MPDGPAVQISVGGSSFAIRRLGRWHTLSEALTVVRSAMSVAPRPKLASSSGHHAVVDQDRVGEVTPVVKAAMNRFETS